ncbi:MAG: hypothetical protein WB562_02060 [Candidatus Sulfotelmatobacter sp.]
MKRTSRTRLLKLLLIPFLVGAGICAAKALPLGTISNPTTVSCGSGYYGGSVCTTVTVSCPNVADVQATYGYHTAKGTELGVVAFINGAQDTIPGGTLYAKGFVAYGFAIYQIVFATGWEATGETPNLMNAACRPATLLSYLQHLKFTLPFGVDAGSAGAGAVGYAMSWYGLTPQAVELSSGPAFSDIELGCEVPRAAHRLVLPTNGAAWTDLVQYNQLNTENNLRAWTGDSTCAGSNFTTPASDAAWKAMSIVSPGARASFPKTVISGWVCNNAINNSASHAYMWFEQVTSPWSLTAMTNCTGAEDVDNATTPQGLTGLEAITADMETNLHF